MLPVNSATADSYDSGNISFISLLCTPDPNSLEIPSVRPSCTNVSMFHSSYFFKSESSLGARIDLLSSSLGRPSSLSFYVVRTLGCK